MCYSQAGNFRPTDSRRRPENGATYCTIYIYNNIRRYLIHTHTCETRGDPLQIYNAVAAMYDLCSIYCIYHYYYTAQHHHHHHHRQQQKYIAHVAIRLLLRQQRSGIEIPLPTYYYFLFFMLHARSNACMEVKK